MVVPQNLAQYYFPLLFPPLPPLTRSYNSGCRIASNSWGLEEQSYYDSLCQQIDDFVWGHNDMFILFAAGNNGEEGYFPRRVLSCSFNTISSPAFAKNALSVGAVYSDYNKIPNGKDYVTYFSSRGDADSPR